MGKPAMQRMSVVQEGDRQPSDDGWVYVQFSDGKDFKTQWETLENLSFFQRYKKSPILVDRKSEGFQTVLDRARDPNSSVHRWDIDNMLSYGMKESLLPSLWYIDFTLMFVMLFFVITVYVANMNVFHYSGVKPMPTINTFINLALIGFTGFYLFRIIKSIHSHATK